MRASIVISSHNEGDSLWQTVRSCKEAAADDLGCEIIVADDASTDDSLEKARERYPDVRIVAREERLGVSPTKDLGGRKAAGSVLIFLDGHCKPELGAIGRLIDDVEEVGDRAVVTPRVPSLDCERWTNSYRSVGYGFYLRLRDFECGWLRKKKLRQKGRFYESPMLVGCCLAVSKELYEKLWGFDTDMLEYGVEDLDFGLKAWLMGYEVLNDPFATIGHRFRKEAANYTVAPEELLVNQLRMARKNFTDPIWTEWLENFHSRVPPERAKATMALYEERVESVTRERDYLLANRRRDEFAYAEEFGLDWPSQPSS